MISISRNLWLKKLERLSLSLHATLVQKNVDLNGKVNAAGLSYILERDILSKMMYILLIEQYALRLIYILILLVLIMSLMTNYEDDDLFACNIDSFYSSILHSLSLEISH